jgi:transcription antitermination factor NusG
MDEMGTSPQTKERNFPTKNLVDPHAEFHWYAVYTTANHEKKVAAELERRSVDFFLPLYHSVRRWKDRRVKLALPLFPGYVFVHLALQDRLRVLQTEGVTRLVGFGGSPAVLPDEEIRSLRLGLKGQLHTAPYPLFTSGRRVRVKSGPLEGMQGLVVRRKNRVRLVVLLESIRRAASVEIEEADLELA